jgi:hypothetical protein
MGGGAGLLVLAGLAAGCQSAPSIRPVPGAPPACSAAKPDVAKPDVAQPDAVAGVPSHLDENLIQDLRRQQGLLDPRDETLLP